MNKKIIFIIDNELNEAIDIINAITKNFDALGYNIKELIDDFNQNINLHFNAIDNCLDISCSFEMFKPIFKLKYDLCTFKNILLGICQMNINYEFILLYGIDCISGSLEDIPMNDILSCADIYYMTFNHTEDVEENDKPGYIIGRFVGFLNSIGYDIKTENGNKKAKLIKIGEDDNE